MAFRSGFVALIGRPNCGKSTLMNAVLGQEVSPVTPLPQTTRRRITGIYTDKNMQIVFVDTPGMHRGSHALNRIMLKTAQDAARDDCLDCLCYLVDLSREFGEEESLIAAIAQKSRAPLLVVFNKKDICKTPEQQRQRFFSLFPELAKAKTVAICARHKDAGKQFLAAVQPFVKEGPRFYDDESLTDSDMRFFAAEFLRKHIILNTRDEVPHTVHVEIESYREQPTLHEIGALIRVESDGQKGIVIGKKGALINRIRADAAKDLERLAGCPVAISCHVKVAPHWRDDRQFLQSAFPASEN